MQVFVVVSHAPTAPLLQSVSVVHEPTVSGRRRGLQPPQLSRMRAPAISACETHPRPAPRRATKSKSSRTSIPESSIVEIVLSNGKMLNISVTSTGPGFRSVRIPVEFVSEKSV